MARSDTRRANQVVEEVALWVRFAEWARYLSLHMPMSGSGALTKEELDILGQFESRELAQDLKLLRDSPVLLPFAGRTLKHQRREALARLEQFRRHVRSWGLHELVGDLYERLLARREAQRTAINERLEELEVRYPVASEIEHLIRHLPLSAGRSVPSTPRDIQQLLDVKAHHAYPSKRLLSDEDCAVGDCASQHESARRLLHLEGSRHALIERRDHLRGRWDDEVEELRASVHEVTRQAARAEEIQHLAQHLPLTRAEALTLAEENALQSISQVRPLAETAGDLLDPEHCRANKCSGTHAAASIVSGWYRDTSIHPILGKLHETRDRLLKQRDVELQEVRASVHEMTRQVGLAEEIRHLVQHLPITRTGALTPEQDLTWATIRV